MWKGVYSIIEKIMEDIQTEEENGEHRMGRS